MINSTPLRLLLNGAGLSHFEDRKRRFGVGKTDANLLIFASRIHVVSLLSLAFTFSLREIILLVRFLHYKFEKKKVVNVRLWLNKWKNQNCNWQRCFGKRFRMRINRQNALLPTPSLLSTENLSFLCLIFALMAPLKF